MKRLRILILVFVSLIAYFFLSKFLPAKRSNNTLIHLHVDNPASREITVLTPIDQTYFLGNKKEYNLDAQNDCMVRLSGNECGNIIIKSDQFFAYLIIEPGNKMKMNIVFDSASRQHITFQGDNAEGNNFLQSLKRDILRDVNNPYKSDTSVAVIEKKIKTLKDTEIQQLGLLLAEKKVSQQFADLLTMDIKYYYAASQVDAFQGKYFVALWAKKNNKPDSIFKTTYADAWKRSFEEMPLNLPEAIGSRYFFSYAEEYFLIYKGDFLKEREAVRNEILKSEDAQKLTSRDLDYLANYQIIDKYFSSKVAEFIKALYINNSTFDQYDQGAISVFEKFKAQYPKSSFTPVVKERVDLVAAFLQTQHKDFTPSQVFWPAADKITSVSQLFSALKGNAYYVDIWSSYCIPCREEFKYSKSLNKVLQGRNMSVLYLSIDEDRSDGEWKSFIKYFDLSGLHVRASDELRKDIFRTLGKNNSLTIPRYLILDKNGSIVNDEAARPSDSTKLSQQISSLTI